MHGIDRRFNRKGPAARRFQPSSRAAVWPLATNGRRDWGQRKHRFDRMAPGFWFVGILPGVGYKVGRWVNSVSGQ
jgi:hypothetical protein